MELPSTMAITARTHVAWGVGVCAPGAGLARPSPGTPLLAGRPRLQEPLEQGVHGTPVRECGWRCPALPRALGPSAAAGRQPKEIIRCLTWVYSSSEYEERSFPYSLCLKPP